MMRRLAVMGALGMLCGALGCGAEEPVTPPPVQQELPLYESPLQAATPPPASGDARVDEAIAGFEPWGYAGDSGPVGGRALHVDGREGSAGFLLKDGRVFFHAAWVGCVPNPSGCALDGALELSVAQMAQLLPVIKAHAVAMEWWAIPWEMVEVLQRSIATWRGEPLPEDVRYTAAEAIPNFIAWSYGYRPDGQGALMVAGNPHSLGFLMKERRVYFHDRWVGCDVGPTSCSMEGATELTLAEMQKLLPILRARAEALGETWFLAREAVRLLEDAIAAKQP